MSDERERAERCAERISAECSEPDGCFDSDKCCQILLAFSREERARVLEQMRNILMESEDFDYYLDWISDQITKLREEGRGDE